MTDTLALFLDENCWRGILATLCIIVQVSILALIHPDWSKSPFDIVYHCGYRNETVCLRLVLCLSLPLSLLSKFELTLCNDDEDDGMKVFLLFILFQMTVFYWIPFGTNNHHLFSFHTASYFLPWRTTTTTTILPFSKFRLLFTSIISLSNYSSAVNLESSQIK